MPIILEAIVRVGRRSNIPNIGVHLIVTSDGRYYFYASKLS